MSHFPEDHVIVMLQGAKKPSRKDALRALARRAAWLSNKIETFAGRALDPAASYLVEELASVAIAVEAIEAAKEPSPAAPAVVPHYFVTIQDKTLYGEPDVALAVVDAPDEETALRSARPTIEELADRGRGRCVPHARQLEPGRYYRLGAVVRLPRDPNAEEDR